MRLLENQATLAFLLPSAFKELFAPRLLVIEHSFVDGYYCHEANWEPISESEIVQLEKYIREWLWDDEPIRFGTWPKSKLLDEMARIKSASKLSNVRHWNSENIPVVQYRNHFDYRIEKMSSDRVDLQTFRLIPYSNGFIMRFPTLSQPDRLEQFQDHPKLFSIIEEQENWASILGVSTVWELNELILSGKINEMLWVAEGFHEKKISRIADGLVENFPEKRIISIAGPSSSGKTTFAKRADIKKSADGIQDFESISAMDIDLFARRLDLLLKGKPIPGREYNFVTGTGSYTDESIELDDRDFIIIEGIHGLNPVLAEKLGGNRIQKIYISALTQLNLDANHRVSTADNRLLRRMVRDHKFRNYLPEQTLERWPSVRLGEENNIFPYQEEADFMFNTALVFEFPVLAKYVLPLLVKIDNDSEHISEARRLITFLSFFEQLDENLVPGISILREFIGDSDLEY